jgi:hypothetical protein
VEDAGAHERALIDLAADARLFPSEPGPIGQMLSGEELAVDQVLTVFGRAEACDFVDLAVGVDRYGLGHVCRLAVERDRASTFVCSGRTFDRLSPDEFELDETRHQRLADAVAQWGYELDRLLLHAPERSGQDATTTSGSAVDPRVGADAHWRLSARA